MSRFGKLVLASLFLLNINMVCNANPSSNTKGWEIDKYLKFNFAYMPDRTALGLPDTQAEKPKSLGLTPIYSADITNINLKGLLGLGFQVPPMEPSDQYNFYIKLFEFPKSFKPEVSTAPVLQAYGLDKFKNNRIKQFVANRNNLAIKMGFIDKSDKKFSKDHPYPVFKVAKNKPDYQKRFNTNLPFYSLYLLPSGNSPQPKSNTAKDLNNSAKYSANGVLVFQKELIDLYKKNYKEVKGKDSSKYYYFMDKSETDSMSGLNKISFLKVPKDPFVFANWRDLPMPHNPKKIFLSGLLLVSRTTYFSSSKLSDIPMPVEAPAFLKVCHDRKTTVLEIGSVFYTDR